MKHRGHSISASTRLKISRALRGRHRGGTTKPKHRRSIRQRASALNGRLEARMINEKYKADSATAAKKKIKSVKKADRVEQKAAKSAAKAKVKAQRESNRLSARATKINAGKAKRKASAHNRRSPMTRRSLARTSAAPKGYHFDRASGKLVKNKKKG